MLVEVIIVVGIGRAAELEAEDISIVRLAAFLSLLLPPQIMLVPALWHREVHFFGAERPPGGSDGIGIACPGYRVFLLVVIAPVVELVVMARVAVLVWAFAVALCDVEFVAPVIGLLDNRWPDWGRPDGLRCGKQKQEEGGDHGENGGICLRRPVF